MPLYEYRCDACGQPEEKLESLSAPQSHACPGCGAQEGMKRQLSVAAFALAGAGWYKGAASWTAPGGGSHLGRRCERCRSCSPRRPRRPSRPSRATAVRPGVAAVPWLDDVCPHSHLMR